jgi:hypothetical protein
MPAPEPISPSPHAEIAAQVPGSGQSVTRGNNNATRLSLLLQCNRHRRPNAPPRRRVVSWYRRGWLLPRSGAHIEFAGLRPGKSRSAEAAMSVTCRGGTVMRASRTARLASACGRSLRRPVVPCVTVNKQQRKPQARQIGSMPGRGVQYGTAASRQSFTGYGSVPEP